MRTNNIYIYIYIYIYICVCMCVCVCTYVYGCVCICVHCAMHLSKFGAKIIYIYIYWDCHFFVEEGHQVNLIRVFRDIETRLTKAWTAINRLSIIWKSDLTDKMKRSFFQAAVTSILLYGCTTWTLTKRLEKKLDGNYTRMLRAILNKSWQQHPTRHQLYGHLPPITKTI